MSEFEEENSVTVKSIDLLNICSQKITSKKANEDKIKDTYREIETLKYDLRELKSQLSRVENSTQFKESYRNLEEIGVLEKEKQEFQRKVSDLYSHVSRAFTKYSYGMTKDTLGRLKVLTEEPWRIFEDAEVSSYASLLIEIQKAVKSGKIKLKDSERIMNYMEIILKSLPEHHDEIRIINLKLNELRENKNGVVVNRSEELKNDIRNCKNRLGDLEQLVDQLKKQLTENNSECEHLVKQIDDYILQITGKKYFVTT
jgi:flagellar capping protein FliD